MEAQAASISIFITAYTLTRYTQRRGGNRNRHERWQKNNWAIMQQIGKKRVIILYNVGQPTNDTTTGYRRNGQNGTRHQADSRHPVRHGGHGGSLARNAGSGAVDKTTTEWPRLLSPGAHRKRRQALCDIQVSHTKQRSRERRAAAHCPRRRADIDKT